MKSINEPKLFRNPLHIGSLRNRPCLCGSGKKIKQCHGQKYGVSLDDAKAINQMVAEYGKKQQQLNNNEGQNV